MTVVAGVPFWETSPEVFGTLVLGKHTIRGIADVDVKRGRKRDKKKAPGKNGVKLGNKGFDAATVKIEWHVFTDEGDKPSARWDEAAAILADLEDAKAAETALAVTHPFCAIRGVTSVVVDDIKGPDVVERSGLFSFTLECTEYSTPAAAKKGTGGGAGAGGIPFDATYVLVAKETGGTLYATDANGNGNGQEIDAASIGDNAPKFGKVVEPTKGVFREAKSGKLVKLLDVAAADKRTPREREEENDLYVKMNAAQKEANTYGNPGGVGGGDIAFVEDEGGKRTETTAYAYAKDKAKTEPKDTAP